MTRPQRSESRAPTGVLGPPEPAEAPRRTGVLMLVRLLGIQVAAAMILLGIPALAPALRAEFELSRAATGALMTAAFLGVVAGSWHAGRIVQAIGVRRSMIAASIGLGAGFALTGVAWSFASVLPILFLAGLFYSPVTPATNAGVVAWAVTGFRTRAMAIKQMGVTAGASISAALIPVLITVFGWRTAVPIVGLLVIVLGIAAANWFRRPEPARSAVQQGQLENPGRVVTLGIAALFLLFVQHCVATHFILALEDRGLALVAAGGALSLLQLSATGARFGWAWIADRLLRGNAALAVLLLSVLTAAVLSWMTIFDGIGLYVPAAILLGATTQAGNGLIQIVLADAGGPSPARSTGLGMALGFSGAVLGPPLFGFLADRWTYRSSWIALALVALGAGLITWQASRSAT